MIKGLDNVYYFVSDMKRAVDFYKNVLGLEIMQQDDHWTSIAMNGSRLALHIANKNEFSASSEKRGGATVTFNVHNIDEAFEHYKSKGVQFLGPISKNPWGNHVTFTDPDGNLLELRQGPKH